jgi:hypothetical protein
LVHDRIEQEGIPMEELTDKSRQGEHPTVQKAGAGGRNEPPKEERIPVERVQTGVRMEKRMLKVLKAMAEYHDCSLGELLEDIVLHSFDGARPFLPESLERIAALRKVYGMDYDVHASYRFVDRTSPKEG